MIRFDNVTIDSRYGGSVTHAGVTKNWRDPVRKDRERRVSFRLVQHLLLAGGKTTRELFDMIYSDCPDGGPLHGHEIIQVVMCRLGPDLEALKLRLRSAKDSGLTRYWLVANA